VEDARWWGAASETSAAEHPYRLVLSRTGVWGYPPDKQLSESESANLYFKYSNIAKRLKPETAFRFPPSRGFSR
jgi:hypothetical protein